MSNLKIRTYRTEKVKVFINVKKGIIATFNRNRPTEEYSVRKFRGLGPVGYPCNVFSKRQVKKTIDSAYFSYLEMHPKLTEEDKEEVMKKIHENLNITVLRALEDYDLVEVGIDGKYGDYLEAMLKPIAKKPGESENEYQKRQARLRQNELRRAGISITYILGNQFINKNTNFFDNLKIKKEAKKYASYARIEHGNRIYGKPMKTLSLKKTAPEAPISNVASEPSISTQPEIIEVKASEVEIDPKKDLKTLKLCKNFGM